MYKKFRQSLKHFFGLNWFKLHNFFIILQKKWNISKQCQMCTTAVYIVSMCFATIRFMLKEWYSCLISVMNIFIYLQLDLFEETHNVLVMLVMDSPIKTIDCIKW